MNRRAPELVHSDRGSQYASCDHRAQLSKRGIALSMSRRGNCWDNAVAESFFGSFNARRVTRFSTTTTSKKRRLTISTSTTTNASTPRSDTQPLPTIKNNFWQLHHLLLTKSNGPANWGKVTMSKVSGSCLCGAVKFTAESIETEQEFLAKFGSPAS